MIRAATRWRAADVGGPYSGAQPVRVVVGHTHGVVFVVEGDHHCHRAEDLFASDGHVHGGVGQHGRGEEEASIERFWQRRLLTTSLECRPLIEAALDQGGDLVLLAGADEWSYLGVRQWRVAEPNGLRACGERVDELVVDSALHEEAGSGDAGLTRAATNAAKASALGGDARVDVIEQSFTGVLPPSSAVMRGEPRRCSDGCGPAGFGTSGKRDLGDVRVTGKPLAGCASARDHVEDTVG